MVLTWMGLAVCVMLLALPAAASAADTVWVDALDLSVAQQQLGQPRPRLSFDGHVMSMGGVQYSRGVGCHANSSLVLDVRGKALSFVARVGVDEEKKGTAGSVEFQVWGDGKLLWHSSVMHSGEPAQAVDVSLSGVHKLELRLTDAGDGNDSDHGDWADARIVADDPLTWLYLRPPVPVAQWNQLTKSQKGAGYHLDQVAAGVWRLRVGQPDTFTPEHFRAAPPMTTALAAMKPTERCPIMPADIQVRTTPRGCAIDLPMAPGEQIYGFGLNIQLFNMNGRRVFIRTSDNPTSPLNDSHAPEPFYLSTAGYGVYVDTSRYASFYTGNVTPSGSEAETASPTSGIAKSTEALYRPRKAPGSTMVVDVPGARGVDIYLFAGPDMKAAVERYNLFSGGGCLPPLWGLGVIYRGAGGFNADQSLKLARSFRDDHMPCDMWGLEPGWQSHAYPCSFTWSKDRFPDPDSFIAQMKAMGYHLSLWEHAFTDASSPLYKPLLPHSGSYLVWGGLVPDFASADTRRLFANYHDVNLVQKGVDLFKLDECDNQPDSAQQWSWPECSAFPSGIDGEEMHSLFGPLYQQTLESIFRKHNRRTYGLVRASYALAAPLPFVIYSDAYDHPDYVRGVAKSGFGGLLWTPEVRDAGSVEELYRRTETVIFSAQALINAWYMNNPPWLQIDKDKSNRGELMPDHQQVTDGIRKLLQLRMSLIPYLYSAFVDYHDRGTPPFRALVLDYPQDPATWNVDDEFLVGPSLLVAPLFAGQTKRTVYLPEGDWYDFWTHQKYAGRQKIEISKPIDQIPVFVKAGALLPLAVPLEHVAPDTCFDVTVHVFGAQPAPFALYEDDGVSYNYEHGDQNRLDLSWAGQKGAVSRTGHYAGPARYRIVGWEVDGN